jgi:hypothetical protein
MRSRSFFSLDTCIQSIEGTKNRAQYEFGRTSDLSSFGALGGTASELKDDEMQQQSKIRRDLRRSSDRKSRKPVAGPAEIDPANFAHPGPSLFDIDIQPSDVQRVAQTVMAALGGGMAKSGKRRNAEKRT